MAPLQGSVPPYESAVFGLDNRESAAHTIAGLVEFGDRVLVLGGPEDKLDAG